MMQASMAQTIIHVSVSRCTVVKRCEIEPRSLITGCRLYSVFSSDSWASLLALRHHSTITIVSYLSVCLFLCNICDVILQT